MIEPGSKLAKWFQRHFGIEPKIYEVPAEDPFDLPRPIVIIPVPAKAVQPPAKKPKRKPAKKVKHR